MTVKPDFPALAPVLDNPYWDRVKQSVSKEKDPIWGTRVIGGGWDVKDVAQAFRLREEVTAVYAWTVTSPQTAQFVAEHCTRRVIDPLAGTGYWGFLLRQFGIKVISTDANPPSAHRGHNHWHPGVNTFVTVYQGDAVDAATMSDTTDTLLLAWPPYNDPIGFKALSAFAGNRLIYIGEGGGGCTGDDDFFALLESEWTELEYHAPVQFYGIHDYVTVYDRNQPTGSS